MAERELDLDKVYEFPKQIKIIKYQNKNLAIYTEGCNWLVLSDSELDVYKYLSNGKSIKKAFENFDEDIVIETLTQIEAKNFEHQVVVDKSSFNLFVYLTNRCNLRCEHCYMYSGTIDICELKVEEWKNIIYDFYKNGGENITFSGGEIVLYERFLLILKYCKDLGLGVTVLSNGLLWTDKMINESYKYIDDIQISVDGYDEQSYLKVRNTNGYNKVISVIKKFSKCGIKVSMAVTPLYDEIDKFANEFKQFAIKFIKENPNIFIKLNLELIAGRNIVISKENNNIYREKLKELVNFIYPNYYIESFAENYQEKNIIKNCGYGDITLAPNGDVYWCNRIHELRSNINILTTTFSKLKKESEKIKQITSVNNVRACSKCEIKYICGGGCRLKYKNFIIDDVQCEHSIYENNCSAEYKENFYKKMIGSNEFFYE